MDIQLILVLLCIAGALFFMGRRFYRCLRKGHCSCGCEGSGNGKKSCRARGCPERKLP
ncbi:hypothetical protein [Desulfovibrio sp. ZJ369]|uniref:hypothetical protein n=1 Tax=Desulfovibrio sp. ZJ369 TaxID=2709793 RepID=UPI001F14B944|nr:hypothetical protein [Desulfovibrio sp. ZJ369]